MNESTSFYIPLGVVSAFWFLVGVLGPIFVPRGPSKMYHKAFVYVYYTHCCLLLPILDRLLLSTVPSFLRTFIENEINTYHAATVDA
uniref:Hypotheticial protein n=1 Tax=Schistosoma japonicum TaxID=6182 RepID=C1L7A0_SCHJA|nr:hypotheticial protein [Schistosoma japonicum]